MSVLSNVECSEVSFDASGETCAATFYRAHGARGKLPCVVMGHGFSGTRNFGLPAYAQRFAAAGMAVLTFDYRQFGASSGLPRQVIDVDRQRDDYRAAIRFARERQDIDPARIALWGTSLSGGHVIAVAADDPRVAAVVAQVPFIDAQHRGSTAGQSLRAVLTPSTLKLLAAAIRDGLGGLLGRRPYLVKVVGKPGEAAVFTDSEARHAIAAMGGERCGWRNEFAPRFLFGLPRYRRGAARQLRMPLLVCVADDDEETSPAFAAQVAAEALHGELKRYPARHFEVYYGSVFGQMVTDQTNFLRTHLVHGQVSASSLGRTAEDACALLDNKSVAK